MADRVLFISWGENVAGREERGLEVFNETVGMYGRFQQEGRIESFDVVLLNPGTGIDGYLALHGSAQQLAAIKEDEEFQRGLLNATLIVHGIKMIDGYTGAGIAKQMEMYQEAISKVPQRA
ncbi:MAG: hypothetical protein QOF64_2496 [Candidatus Binatota bacterium]|jgi:hypothetical protein|nr:hypothetical protein [Candidatus Binatota bacterium]